jgi:hypothetical protein
MKVVQLSDLRNLAKIQALLGAPGEKVIHVMSRGKFIWRLTPSEHAYVQPEPVTKQPQKDRTDYELLLLGPVALEGMVERGELTQEKFDYLMDQPSPDYLGQQTPAKKEPVI